MFDWENKYRNTVVDIKSNYLKEPLQEILKDVKSCSLAENQPSLDPNTLFLYVEDMRKYYKKTLKSKIKKEKKKKAIFPMIKAGNITFEYLWALFKPNTLAYSTTYGAGDHPRAFKVDFA